ncbi:MAG: serine/threonine protein kinase [Planctomycetes bacterium]|nr:serine/threonine protein kinase [Planctomycetota bacterium]
MSSKSDIIYRKLVLAHKLIPDAELLGCILVVEKIRKTDNDISLLEILLKKNLISPDDGLILRSEHDKVSHKIKEKTKSIRKKTKKTEASLHEDETSKLLEKTINETIDNNPDIIAGDKLTNAKTDRKQVKNSTKTGEARKRKTSGKRATRPKSKRTVSSRKPLKTVADTKIDAKDEKTLILTNHPVKTNAKSKSNIDTLEVDADPDILERDKYDPRKDPLVNKIFGGCKLISKIGEGGMGSVYKAFHIGLDKNVALKILPPNQLDSADRIKRFKHEAKSAAKMEHPNIVQILNIGEDDGIHFIVMQFIDGEDLRQRLLRKGVFPPIEALDICMQVAEGLNVAHKKGIIHRDIKPDNIMIEREGNVKITDFGLARQMEHGLDISKPGKALGTPYYMSPEQCSGKDLDGRSDIYSLGVSLYHIVTGKRPFKGKNAVATALMHIREPVTPPEKINPNLPIPLADLVLKMMEKNPQNRFQNCNELEEALKITKHSILNTKELGTLVNQDVQSQSATMQGSLYSTGASKQDEIGNVRKKIAITAGVGAIMLIIAIVLFVSLFTGEPVDPDGIGPNKTNGASNSGSPFPRTNKELQREEAAKEMWKIKRKSVNQLVEAMLFDNSFQEIDDFIDKYSGTKTAVSAKEYRKELVNKREQLAQMEFERVTKDYDKLIKEKKYTEVKANLRSFLAKLTTYEINEEIQNREKHIDMLIGKKWTEFRIEVVKFTRKSPAQYFDALEVLENTEEIGDPIFDVQLKELKEKVQKEFNRKVNGELAKKAEEQRKQTYFATRLTNILKTRLVPLKSYDSFADNVLKDVTKEIKDCSKYTYVLPVLKLIERDLQSITYFQDVVINKIFKTFEIKNKKTEIKTLDKGTLEGRIVSTDSDSLKIRVSDEVIELKWSELSPRYVSELAFKYIKPETDIIKALTIPLFLLSVKDYSEMNKYLGKLPKSVKSKIEWRFHVPIRADEWNWFSIYYAELFGLLSLKEYIVDESKPVGDSFKEALIVNPRSAWACIAAAIKAKQRGNIKIMLRLLENVVEEYTKLKDYLKLYAMAMIHMKKYSDARKTMSILDKNFLDDADVMLLNAKMYIAQAKKQLAREELTEARKNHPYNKEIWLLLKDLK